MVLEDHSQTNLGCIQAYHATRSAREVGRQGRMSRATCQYTTQTRLGAIWPYFLEPNWVALLNGENRSCVSFFVCELFEGLHSSCAAHTKAIIGADRGQTDYWYLKFYTFLVPNLNFLSKGENFFSLPFLVWPVEGGAIQVLHPVYGNENHD